MDVDGPFTYIANQFHIRLVVVIVLVLVTVLDSIVVIVIVMNKKSILLGSI